MAAIPPPKRHSSKGTPPTPDEAGNSLDLPDTGDLAPLNFKVSPAFRRAFKLYATRAGISMKELLDRSFREYQERHPVTD
jgi:hypothetical protein